ncbi:hypothetical protein CPB84DRAFT_1851575 [Gymnopilus junonius]|uniref:Uncharacterized protein n=1 Tax=Gymnopilus junonius TaxID=109634 RepID=A0A9P5NC89_GYMJU|nr:hypothetical protein CPB84DRAFT_1851575 [Gymnopilus junonius]
MQETHRRCEKLNEIGFSTNIIIGSYTEGLGSLFEPTDVVQPFISCLTEYEEHIFRGYDEGAVQMRALLGLKSHYNNLPEHLAQQLSQLQLSKLGMSMAPTKMVPKCLDKDMLEMIKIPHYDRLYDIPDLLQEVRSYGENIVHGPPAPNHLTDDLIAHHLKTVAYQHVQGEIDNIVENFSLAAFNLAYKFKGHPPSPGQLPTIPGKWSGFKDYINVNEWSNSDEYRVKQFFKNTKPSQL